MKANDILLQSASLSSSIIDGVETYTLHLIDESFQTGSIDGSKIKWLLGYEHPSTGIYSEEGLLLEIQPTDISEILANSGNCYVESIVSKIHNPEDRDDSLIIENTGSIDSDVEDPNISKYYMSTDVRYLDGYCVIHK